MILFLIAFILLVSFLHAKSVRAISKLHVEGRYIKNETGSIVFLRGINKAGFEQDATGWWNPEGGEWSSGLGNWSPEAVKANLDAIKSWGCNALRLITTIDYWKFDNATLNYRQHIKDVITWAGERGIYVIFTPYQVKHYPLGEQEDLPYPPYHNFPDVIADKDEFVRYWISVAEELKSYPNVIFELWNEPYGSADAKRGWFEVAQLSINKIRETGADQLIIFQWGSEVNPGAGNLSWIQEQPVQGTNIVYSTHCYRDKACFGEDEPYDYDTIKLRLEQGKVKWVGDSLNKPLIIGAVGARMWKTDTELSNELDAFEYALSVFNEWDLHYIGSEWFTTNKPYGMLQSEAWIPDPNEAGQRLIDAIGIGKTMRSKARIIGRLKNATGQVVKADVAAYESETKTMANSTQTDANGNYELTVPIGTYDVQFDLLEDFFISNFFIKLLSIDMSSDAHDLISGITWHTSQTINNVSIIADISSGQVFQTRSWQRPSKLTANGVELTEVSSASALTSNTWFYDPVERILTIKVG